MNNIRVYFCRNTTNGSGIPSALSKLELRDDVTLEAVPCSGRIDPRYLLKAFEAGASAVCVLTCANGHCKLMEGNLRAARRTHAVNKLLAEAGLSPDSVQVFLPSEPGSEALDKAVGSIVQFVNEPAQMVVA